MLTGLSGGGIRARKNGSSRRMPTTVELPNELLKLQDEWRSLAGRPDGRRLQEDLYAAGSGPLMRPCSRSCRYTVHRTGCLLSRTTDAPW